MTRLVALVVIMMACSSVGAVPVINTKPEKPGWNYYYPDGTHDGCDWYCVGCDPKVTASSQYGGRRKADFAPRKAHDWNFKTAWVEGKNGYGVGEYLEYSFRIEKDGQRGADIDGLIIVNGYRKSESLWKANSRVKKLRMYVDGRELCLIQLKDAPDVQTAEIPVIRLKPGKAKVLRFEIVEVFRGCKYKDTAISELLVNGPSGH